MIVTYLPWLLSFITIWMTLLAALIHRTNVLNKRPPCREIRRRPLVARLNTPNTEVCGNERR